MITLLFLLNCSFSIRNMLYNGLCFFSHNYSAHMKKLPLSDPCADVRRKPMLHATRFFLT